MHFPYARSPRALVKPPINRGRHRQRTANNGSNAGEEAGECLRSGFAVDDFHGGDVVGEEYTGYTASVSHED